SLLGQSHCSFVPESSSRARNQDLLHRDLLAWVNLVNTPQCMRHSRRRRPIRARNRGSLVSIRGVRDEMAASCCSNITRARKKESYSTTVQHGILQRRQLRQEQHLRAEGAVC